MNLVNIKNQVLQTQLIGKEEQEKRCDFNFLNTVASKMMNCHLAENRYESCFELLAKMRDEKAQEYVYWRDRIEDDIIRTNALFNLCHFARRFPDANIKRLEEVVVSSARISCNDDGSPYQPFPAYMFARDVKGANVKLLEDIIIKSNTNVIVYFAKDVEGANIQRLQNRVIELGYPNMILEFAEEVQGANIKELEDAILKTKDYYSWIRFARTVKGANKTRIEKKIAELNNPKYASFLLYHDLAVEYKQTLEDIVLNGSDAEACLNLAKKRNDEKFKALVCKIADIGNVEICKRALNELELNYILRDLLMFSIGANREIGINSSKESETNNLFFSFGRYA